MNVSNRDNLFYEANFTASLVCTALNDTFNLGIDKKYYGNSTLSQKLKKIIYLNGSFILHFQKQKSPKSIAIALFFRT